MHTCTVSFAAITIETCLTHAKLLLIEIMWSKAVAFVVTITIHSAHPCEERTQLSIEINKPFSELVNQKKKTLRIIYIFFIFYVFIYIYIYIVVFDVDV